MIFRFALYNPDLGTLILPSDPVGWESLLLEFKRDQDLHGIFLEYSLDLKFFCGSGKEYLDKVYTEQGLDADIDLFVSVACGCVPGEDSLDYSIDYSDNYGTPSEGCQYEELFRGKIDLSTYQSDPVFTSVNVLQADIYSKLKARLDTKVALTKLNSVEGVGLSPFEFGPYEMSLHSKRIVFQSQWEPNEPGNSFETDTFELGLKHSPPLDLMVTDIPGSQSSFTDVTDPSAAIWQNLIGAEQTIKIEGEIKLSTYQELTYKTEGGTSSATINFSGGYTYYLSILDESWNLVSFVELHQEPNVPTLVPLDSSFTINETLVVPPLHYVNLIYQLDNIDFSGYEPPDSGNPISPVELLAIHAEYIYHKDSLIKGTVDSIVPESQCNVFAIHEALARISQVITDQSDVLRSNYFGRKNSEPISYSENGCGSFTAITNGSLIRQFPITERPVYTSMKELYNNLDAIHNLGMGIERVGEDYKIRIEPKEYFYSNDVSVTLTNVPNIKMSIATDYIYNNITIGYSTWESESINGIDEFNSKRQYTLGLKRSDALDEILSNLVASGYAIEFTRRKKYKDSANEDYKYDNNNFIICLNRSVDGAGVPNNLTTAEKNENFSDVQNLISPETAYNLRISPNRNLLRRYSNIAGTLEICPGKAVQFAFGDGNYFLQSTLNGDCQESDYSAPLKENQAIIEAPTDPLWIPEMYEFSCPLTFEQYKTIQANPYKCIEFSSGDGDYIKGAIIDLRYKLAGGMTEFKLLRVE